MIYSQWKPSLGGYDYFQATDRDIPLGNDLPVPRLPSGTAIGVASIDAGRPIPAGAKFIGSGQEAKGLIAPSVSRGLGAAITDVFSANYLYMAAGVFIGWFVSRKK